MLHLESSRSTTDRGRFGSTFVRAFLLVGIGLVALGVVPAQAQSPQSVSLAAPRLSADPGDTVAVRVDLTSLIGVSELATLKFAVRVDTTVLEPIDAEPGPALGSWPAADFSSVVDGDRLSVSALTDPAVAVQTGALAFFHFRVRDEVLDGASTDLDLTATNDEQAIVVLTDPLQSPPGIKTVDVDGQLTVTNGVTCLAGDADADGVVTTADAILALRVALGLVDEPSIETLCGADADGDREYDVFDATWILRTVVGLPPAKAAASTAVPAVSLRRDADAIHLEVEGAESVVAAQVHVRALDGARWLGSDGPSGTLSLSGVRGDELRLGMARSRGGAASLRFDLEAESAGRLVVEHVRLFGADGELLDYETGATTLELSPTGPVLSRLALDSYPNPFNPSTTLRLDLPRSGRARVEIFDVSGRRVTTLLDGELSAGRQEITWHGRDDQGRAVASGVYFARLVHEGDQARQRLLLVK